MFTQICGHFFPFISTSIPTLVPRIERMSCRPTGAEHSGSAFHDTRCVLPKYGLKSSFILIMISWIKFLNMCSVPITSLKSSNYAYFKNLYACPLSLSLASSLLILNSLYHFDFDQVLSFLLFVFIMSSVELSFLCCFQFDLHFCDLFSSFPSSAPSPFPLAIFLSVPWDLWARFMVVIASLFIYQLLLTKF